MDDGGIWAWRMVEPRQTTVTWTTLSTTEFHGEERVASMEGGAAGGEPEHRGELAGTAAGTQSW
jgi:hypothetical protein